jgi:hypothetical protein
MFPSQLQIQPAHVVKDKDMNRPMPQTVTVNRPPGRLPDKSVMAIKDLQDFLLFVHCFPSFYASFEIVVP